MSRFAVFLFILTSCALGCRHVSRLEVKDIPSPPCPVPAPTMSTQREIAKFAPEAVPAEQSLARPIQMETEPLSKTPIPANIVGIIASSKKESTCDSVRPNVGASKVSKPASAPVIEVAEGEKAKDHSKTPTPAFSRDFWYGIATVFGAVFTTILAPIVVDIAKGRMASGRNSADSSRPITT